MAVQFAIESWRPGRDPKFNVGDGAVDAVLDTCRGPVKYYSFVGDDECDEFTTLEMRIEWRVFHSRLDRYYHPLWARRLANEFAEQVHKLCNPS